MNSVNGGLAEERQLVSGCGVAGGTGGAGHFFFLLSRVSKGKMSSIS